MKSIIKDNGYWRAIKHEPDTKQCHINLTNRINFMSSNNNFNQSCEQWTNIIGNEEYTEATLCLCGMKIYKTYYFINHNTKQIAQIGEQCCIRINKTSVKNYKESLKIKGNCYLCKTNHKDIETHYNSKNHKNKHIKFSEDRKSTLSSFIVNHVKKIKKEEKIRKIFRKCIETNCEAFIKKTEPNWKTRCVKCFLNNKKYSLYINAE